ncbi:hypothetical protein ACFWZ1_08600 [Frateuria sp. GZRe14]|uniref:hypothetical protein n=1 Tax=Frateuria sp. GZRe14 TaxID=3351534 RepID=UPI003EDB6F26
MTDFLDRLATRALGGEGLLLPRLPSLFEPQGVAVMPPMGEMHGEPGRRDVVSAGIEAAPVAHERRSAPSHPVSGSAIAAAPIPAVGAPALEPSPRPTSIEPPAATVAVIERRPYRAEEQPKEPTPHRNAAAAPPQARAREAHAVSVDPIAPPRPQPRRGSLLPPTSPVFAAPRAGAPVQPRGSRFDAARSRPELADSGRGGASEPVIHVSIGRLEVRALPAAPASRPRRDEPRPGSLDDYLRQRGKASP